VGSSDQRHVDAEMARAISLAPAAYCIDRSDVGIGRYLEHCENELDFLRQRRNVIPIREEGRHATIQRRW
jgi:hypothetical protein